MGILVRTIPGPECAWPGLVRWVLLSALLAVSSPTSYGGINVWTSRGPEGGFVGTPAIDPQNPGTLYVAAGGRVFKTTDAAVRWTALSRAPTMTVLAVDPQNSSTLYGSDNQALFKSTDGGLIWNAAGAGLACPCAELTFIIDPGNPSILYIGTGSSATSPGGEVLKSTDGGATWSAASSGLPVLADGRTFSGIHALVIDPKNTSTLYAATSLPLSSGGGVFKSMDGAASWSAVNSGLTGRFIASLTIDPRNPNTLYASSPYPEGRGLPTLFTSTDGASSWNPASVGFDARPLAIDPQDSATLYALNNSDTGSNPSNPKWLGFPAYRGILKSTDGGGTWSVVLSGGSGNGWVTVTQGESGPSTVYAGIDGRGILKSTDGGKTWATANSGIAATSITGMAINFGNPSTLYAGVAGASIFKSTDGAQTWSANPVVPGPVGLAIDPHNVDTVYALTSDLVVSKSTDGGASWVQLLAPSFTSVLVIDPINTGTLYFGPLKSADGGATWQKMGLTQEQFPTALVVDPQNPDTLYAGTPQPDNMPLATPALSIRGQVLKSVNGGRSWSEANPGWPGYAVCCLHLDPNDSSIVYAETTWLDCEWVNCSGDYWDPNSEHARNGLGLFKSVDGGATWVKLDRPGDVGSILGISPQGTLYAGGSSGLVRSVDGGSTWSDLVTTGLTSGVNVLAFDPQDPNHLFAGTHNAGVFEITLTPEKE
jgi:photosystem II stability/assembly factor-like uncharacterized protein